MKKETPKEKHSKAQIFPSNSVIQLIQILSAFTKKFVITLF
jgi:hypothetical protein